MQAQPGIHLRAQLDNKLTTVDIGEEIYAVQSYLGNSKQLLDNGTSWETERCNTEISMQLYGILGKPLPASNLGGRAMQCKAI